MPSRTADWLDQRTGYRARLAHALEEPVVGGARWAYVFGSALAFLFVMQAVTGVLLALYYAPASQEAWGSVYYLHRHVRMGWFVRGLHHWGSSAMVILLVLHLAQVFIYGAYRPPRELGWWTGLLLLFVALAFSLTGYLLPWDQKGYWATRVVTSIAGTFPWFGPWLKGTLQGGNDFGNLTLTRFFGFHVFFLPAGLTLLLVAHVALFRRHGVTPRWSYTRAELDARTEPFWPRSLTYDMAFATALVGVLVALTLWHHGASLEAPANPSSNYLARPEWYFLWLFELLKVLPGKWEGFGVLGFVELAFAFLAALPLVDRAPSTSPRDRWPHFVIAIAIAGTIATLTVMPMLADARDTGVEAQERIAEAERQRAFALAELGIPPGGADDLLLNDPRERGKRIFASLCQTCHKADGKGGDSAPDLTGFMTREWVRRVTADPTRPEFFGRTKVSGMDPTEATREELDTLTDYMLSQGGLARAPANGSDLYEEKGCQNCHARAGEEPLSGPSLAGYGSPQWVKGAILRPGSPEYYGDQNQMPSFDGKLTEAQLDDLIAWLLPTTRSQRSP